ncbi:hypothetical protein B0H13DRAFT_1862204 [Mycena leptocephala]|nr:hypothetical protein B0H13DRAFT_1862204 [Mycena leptocephala]
MPTRYLRHLLVLLIPLLLSPYPTNLPSVRTPPPPPPPKRKEHPEIDPLDSPTPLGQLPKRLTLCFTDVEKLEKGCRPGPWARFHGTRGTGAVPVPSGILLDTPRHGSEPFLPWKHGRHGYFHFMLNKRFNGSWFVAGLGERFRDIGHPNGPQRVNH